MPHLWDIHLRRLTAASQPLVAVKVAPAPPRHYQKVGNPAIPGFILALGSRVTIVNHSKHSAGGGRPANPQNQRKQKPPPQTFGCSKYGSYVIWRQFLWTLRWSDQHLHNRKYLVFYEHVLRISHCFYVTFLVFPFIVVLFYFFILNEHGWYIKSLHNLVLLSPAIKVILKNNRDCWVYWDLSVVFEVRLYVLEI